MKTLVMCQGLPGSGKSTWAAEQARDHLAVVVNKDDIRAELGGWTKEGEAQVVAIRDVRIRNAFDHGATLVISSDTNFARHHKVELSHLAHLQGATFKIVKFNHVSIEECIRRDALREGALSVGPAVIHKMVRQFHLDTDPTWYGPDLTIGMLPYRHTPGLPGAVMCDLDGTAALFEGRRSAYDASTCDQDEANFPVLETLRGFSFRRYDILYTSAREDRYRQQTDSFFIRHDFPKGQLFMREAGDIRKDWIVKGELFERHIRGQYNILLVLDDRNQVVDFWRRLGLTVFQVAPGDF